MNECICKNWARSGGKLATEHHSQCANYDPEGDARKVIEALLKGVEGWAKDCDGIPSECWEPYKQAKAFVGQFDWREKV